ncbi:LANO_0G13058g1_1 [Lachancea nothofagi CBS 11611]|uniref:Large ribosomal subunit protein uL29m n=1 Tax=Lachancea nothofagi CBS 11611 TaxID=1266666 RepID=A0A1G4KK96_9SACH|nr:LANO_0G13058g1_1 [Lachancea nothofagi CBS 11611]
MFSVKRGLHTTALACARTKYTKPKPKPRFRRNVRSPTQTTHHNNNLSVTAPIPPAAANIVTPDDHPLWQFFADKKYLRKFDELDNDSRPWAVPELRRKSFDDLHSLWYTCLRERNVLARENHLLKNDMGSNQDSYETVAEKIRTTMWRIRHVISERDWAFQKANQELGSQREQFLKEFENDFLEAPAAEDEESFEKLARLQQSIFGISEYIDENTVDRSFVDGMKYVATLKLRKFASRQSEILDLLEQSEHSIQDAGEAFVLFTAENTEAAVKEACDIVKDLRAKNSSVSRYEELETVGDYIKQLAASQVENNTSSSA